MNSTINIDPVAFTGLFGDGGERWIQGSWSNDRGLCMHEGIKRCTAKQPGDFHLIEQVAKAEGWGPTWNDTDGRTWDEVKTKMFEVAEITPDRLEQVFGPQWSEIVALVRRATVLTETEIDTLTATQNASWNAALIAAWDAAWYAAQDAAQDAARDAAWIAAWNAARNAAWDAAWHAAQGAAWGATSALVCRDLITPDGFTQTHYDTLTAPWANTIGPAHPNDLPVVA